jgi:hypothetical protein
LFLCFILIYFFWETDVVKFVVYLVLSPTALSSPKEGKEKEIVEQCQVFILGQLSTPTQLDTVVVNFSSSETSSLSLSLMFQILDPFV